MISNTLVRIGPVKVWTPKMKHWSLDNQYFTGYWSTLFTMSYALLASLYTRAKDFIAKLHLFARPWHNVFYPVHALPFKTSPPNHPGSFIRHYINCDIQQQEVNLRLGMILPMVCHPFTCPAKILKLTENNFCFISFPPKSTLTEPSLSLV